MEATHRESISDITLVQTGGLDRLLIVRQVLQIVTFAAPFAILPNTVAMTTSASFPQTSERNFSRNAMLLIWLIALAKLLFHIYFNNQIRLLPR